MRSFQCQEQNEEENKIKMTLLPETTNREMERAGRKVPNPTMEKALTTFTNLYLLTQFCWLGDENERFVSLSLIVR